MRTPVASRSSSCAAEAVPGAASTETSVAAAMASRRTPHWSAPRQRRDIPHRGGGSSEARGSAGVARVGAALDDLGELRDRVLELVLGVVEVRAEPDSGVGTEVADDPALTELTVHGRVVGGADEDRAAAPCRLARARDLEACGVERVDQELRQREGALADPFHADLFDHVVAGGRGVERGHVRRAGQEAARAGRVLELRLEGERPRMTLPADERRLEPL